MKKRWVLLVGVLVLIFSMSVSVLAEEAPETTPGSVLGGLLGSLLPDGEVSEKLFGEDGIITGALPEGTDLNEIASTFSEQFGALKTQGQKVLEYIREKAQDNGGSFQFDGSTTRELKDIAGGLFGALTGRFGSGDIDFSELDALMEKYEALAAAEDDFILAVNSEIMETGDVQLLSTYPLGNNDDDLAGEEVKTLTYASVTNYTEDGTVLRIQSGGDSPILFTLVWNEESGTYTVKDAKETTEGEEFTASLQAMCDEVGADFNEALLDIEYAKAFHIGDMAEFLKDHPEYDGMEFQGEIKTADELEQIENELLIALEP